MESLPPVVAFLAFLTFLALLVRVRGARSETPRRTRINQLLVYLIVANGLVGLSQRDAWPFTQYTLAAFRARIDAPVCHTQFFGVDGRGGEWQADPLSWTSVYDSILQYWFELNWRQLDPVAGRHVLSFLFDKAEQARARLARGAGVGYERRLGPVYARYWWLLPRVADVSPEPYTGLRVYRACRIPQEWLTEGKPWQRTLIVEWKR